MIERERVRLRREGGRLYFECDKAHHATSSIVTSTYYHILVINQLPFVTSLNLTILNYMIISHNTTTNINNDNKMQNFKKNLEKFEFSNRQLSGNGKSRRLYTPKRVELI